MNNNVKILFIVITIVLLIVTCYINLTPQSISYCYPKDNIVNMIEALAFVSSILGVLIGLVITVKARDNSFVGQYLLVMCVFYVIVPFVLLTVSGKIHEIDAANNEPTNCTVWTNIQR